MDEKLRHIVSRKLGSDCVISHTFWDYKAVQALREGPVTRVFPLPTYRYTAGSHGVNLLGRHEGRRQGGAIVTSYLAYCAPRSVKMQVCPWDSERDQDMRTRAPMHGQGQMNRSARIIEPKENAWDFQAFKKAYLERCSLTVMTPVLAILDSSVRRARPTRWRIKPAAKVGAVRITRPGARPPAVASACCR